MSSRMIQVICLAVMVVSATMAGSLLPPLLKQSEEAGLRYTDVSVDGAPPWVMIGTAIGAVRGLIVDILWLKVNYMKQKGLFYEVMNDASLITKLQPRFGDVWVFHGHNMAYNISVATHTQEERWEWVQAGIRLVRNEGLRHNPNDIALYRELAFWFAHKIEGYSDDAHLFYKRQFANEWHGLLGRPPDALEDRIAWIKEIADAPGTLDELVLAHPRVKELIDRLDAGVKRTDPKNKMRLDRSLLDNYSLWEAVTKYSDAAAVTGRYDYYRQNASAFVAFDDVAADETLAVEWSALMAFVRHQVLLADYNMNPQYMYEFTRDYGPLDWRHGQSHALYWSALGARFGGLRVSNTDNVYKALNNDRIFLQSMQALSRWGRIYYDPFGPQDLPPTRMPDPLWIDTIEDQFVYFYDKYYGTRGAGSDTFIGFLQNFMSSAVRQCYRSGEHERAQQLLDQLNVRFGTGRQDSMADPKYAQSLDIFVRDEIRDQYASQPALAPSEAYSSLKYALRVGIGQDREDVYRNALVFIDQVVTIFKQNEYYQFTTKFGTSRMADLLTNPEQMKEGALMNVMLESGIPLRERATIWARYDPIVGRVERGNDRATLRRAMVYDAILPGITTQLGRHPLGVKYTAEELFPPPPRLADARRLLAQRRARQQQQEEAGRGSDRIGASGSGPKLGGRE